MMFSTSYEEDLKYNRYLKAMEIKPVTEFYEPDYPKLEDFLRNPHSIVNHAPERWKGNSVLWAALISLAVGNQSCDFIQNKHSRIEFIRIHERFNKNDSKENEIPKDSSFVAPLFHHGDGIGAYGCVVIMPPVFINELEAKQIILNELKKENLLFDTTEQPVRKILIKTDKKLWEESNGDYKVRDTTELRELTFDGYNKELNFAFCFLSDRKYNAFADYEPEYSSVSLEDFKKTSEKLRTEIKKVNDLNAVVFYDPIPYPARDEDWNWDRAKSHEMMNKRKEMAVDSLKAQVTDFIRWLKTEKIILK
jgi:hypothetical protein